MSAQTLAAKIQPGSVVRWDRIESAAFASHPSVLRGAAAGGRARARFGRSNWNLIWGIPLVILYLFCYTAPIWGAAAISVSRFQSYQQDPEQRIQLSGVIFIFALLLLVVSFVHWLVSGRRPSGFYEIQAALALILGGLSAVAARLYGVRDSVDGWQTWVTPILGATVLGGVFLISLVVSHLAQHSHARSGSASDARDVLPRNKLELLKQRRERLEQLSDRERADIKNDIDAAISELTARGLISDAEAERARGTELGALALKMGKK